MKLLIKKATIICPSSPFHGTEKDILVIDGFIDSIANAIIETADTTIDQSGLKLSIGWMDIFANFCDPGLEYRETMESGAKAAAAGGFTDVMILPNTHPVVDSKSQIEYIVQKAKDLPVHIHPIGAITKNIAGKQLAEMYDMQQSGAVAFGDGTSSVQDAGLLVKALQYVKVFDGTIIQIPDDRSIGERGLMNEGIVSTQLGLPGKPGMAEELMVTRDIKLAGYADSKIHITGISTAKSVEYIRIAKADGIKISCSVTPYHLYFCDEDLKDYDTNLKVNPPLRTKADRDALQKALLDGTIDCMASHHLPHNTDSKVCEFENAKTGMIGLESLFGVINAVGSWQLPVANPLLIIERIIELLSVHPRNIFGLAIPEIKEGSKACLTLFNMEEEYIFTESMIRSKSKNSPFVGKTLKGKVVGIVNGNCIELN
jgi:dihydroorotase